MTLMTIAMRASATSAITARRCLYKKGNSGDARWVLVGESRGGRSLHSMPFQYLWRPVPAGSGYQPRFELGGLAAGRSALAGELAGLAAGRLALAGELAGGLAGPGAWSWSGRRAV